MSDDTQRPERSRRSENPRPPARPGGYWRTIVFWLTMIAGVVLLYSVMTRLSNATAEISYSEFVGQVDKQNIAEVTLSDLAVSGKLRKPTVFAGNRVSSPVSQFTTRLPFSDNSYELTRRIEAAGIKIVAKEQDPNFWSVALTLAPFLVIGVFFYFLMRQMQGAAGPKGLFSFGKSRAKLNTDERPKVTFSDVAGADEAKEELQEIIEFLKEPGKFQKLGGKIPKGALLLGPPGTGKTLLARAVAGEAGVPFFSMSGSDFVEMFVGVGASRVRDLFEQGKKNAPCIIFIDEIDAVGRHRGAGLGGGHDEREQTLNQLLVEMDGFESNDGVILIAATNRPDVLDPALMRPGRFDRQIVVATPDVKGREGILKVHLRKVKTSPEIDVSVLARGTPGMSGADLANMVNEAALLASRRNRDAILMEDFEEAKDKVMMGSARKSMVITDSEKEIIAYHEAGHALVAKLLPKADPIHKVTIIPRGMALGVTQSLPVDERHTHSREYLESLLAVMMGGRVAEIIIFNQLDTGAGNDLERATRLARKMVCNWGMSDQLGPVTFGKTDEHIFLGREIQHQKEYSEETARLIDQEIRRFVEAAEETAKRIVQNHVEKLHAIARALLEREIIDGREVDEIINRPSGDPTAVPIPAPA